MVGVIGLWQPNALGLGFDFLGTVLQGQDNLLLKAALFLLLAKVLSTAVSYGSGMSGGIVGPSLFIGGLLGTAMWRLQQSFACR
jgi:CIC family chloride channel protein